jgi:hypothetical protein
MGLVERLMGTELPKIPWHQFSACMGEWERGKMTRAQVLTGLAQISRNQDETNSPHPLTAPEEAELDALFAKIIPATETHPLGAFVTLTNIGATYDSTVAAKGLGMTYIEGAGLTGLQWHCRWNKIGTGTLSFQLWNETAGAELALIEDAAVAGDNRSDTKTVVPGVPLAPGLHLVRVRAKSTVATDDPLYYGGTLRVRRVDTLTSDILEKIGVLSEKAIPPLATPAAVRARLGI